MKGKAVSFAFAGDICPNRARYVGRYNKVLSPRYSASKDAIGWAAKQAMKAREPITGPVRVDYVFWHRCDIDGIDKVLLDAMEGIVYINDRQVTEKSERKFRQRGKPEVWVTVRELPGGKERGQDVLEKLDGFRKDHSGRDRSLELVTAGRGRL
jgi:Holliday junction resolvase RusA-like endonuclease